MFKILFAIAILSGTTTLFAQDMERDSSVGKVTGTMPEMKEESTASQQKWRAGLTTGFNSPKGDIGTTAEFGVTTAFQPVALGNFGFGLDAGTSRLDNANRYQRTSVMINGLYNIGGDTPILKTSYLGVGGGPIILSNKVYWGYAPVVGFDVPFNNKMHDFLSLGLTAKYLINPNTPNSLAGAAALKYWF